MESAQVIIGQTAEASQYDGLRKDVMHAGYYPIEDVDNDDVFKVENEIVGDLCAVVFSGLQQATCYWDVQVPPFIDTGEDWELRVAFDMKTSEAAKAARFQLQYASIADGGDTTPALTTLEETVSTPNTTEILKTVFLSTIKIPNSVLSAGKQAVFKFSRLGDDPSDTHGGELRMFSVVLIQNQTPI